MADFSTFLSWENTTRDVMDVKKIYFDLAGDIHAGLILAELVYWYLPNKNGESKLRVKRDGHDWIVVPRYEWWERCRLSPRQADRALAALKRAGLIITERFRYNNSPTTHIRLNGEIFLTRWNQLLQIPLQNPFLPNGENANSPNGENANSPNGENARSHQTVKTMISPNGELEFTKWGELITETTTETTETTVIDDEDEDTRARATALSDVLQAAIDIAETKTEAPPPPGEHASGQISADLAAVTTAYENNIGLSTPMIRDELIEFVDTYPADWILDAIKAAVTHEARSLAYVRSCLKNWHRHGRSTVLGARQPGPPTAADPEILAALCQAWGYDLAGLTRTKRSDLERVAVELVDAGARPGQIGPFKGWLDAKAAREQWSYTVKAMPQYWPDFAAVLARNEERTRQAVPKRIPTLEDKMNKAAYYRWLCAQGRTDEAQRMTYNDVWRLQEAGQFPAGAQLG